MTCSRVKFKLFYLLFLSDFNDRFSKNTYNIKFHENPSSGSRFVPRRQTDGETDMTKLIVAFRSFVNAPNKRTCKTKQ